VEASDDVEVGRCLLSPITWLDRSVGSEYPKLLEDREVLIVREGQQQRARLRGLLDGYDGPRPKYRIELLVGLDPYTSTAMDMFEALVRLRRQLEPEGWMVAVQGSRRDTYPSGMARDMGGGRRIYVMRPGQKAARDDLVDTLADAPIDQLATVDEQQVYRDAWHAETKR
jgi:hypothetical protein